MQPSLIVDGQDGVRTVLLKASDERFQTVYRASDEHGAAERLQTAAVLPVVLLDQVIDAHRRVTVGYVDAAPCRTHFQKSYGYMHRQSPSFKSSKDTFLKKLILIFCFELCSNFSYFTLYKSRGDWTINKMF